MFEPEQFTHFVGYGSTDQKTLRSFIGGYDGVLVPATIAAFQQQGTGGFVLTLSAAEPSAPFVIDPRFPLFQQRLEEPKLSHLALAELLGDRKLVTTNEDRDVSYFDDDKIERIATAWVRFNQSYRTEQSTKFSKYAKRLGRDLTPEQASGPQRILAPYFSVSGPDDPWWSTACKMLEVTRSVPDRSLPVTRVVATQSTVALAAVLDGIAPEELCVWVSGLSELNSSAADLALYAETVRESCRQGHSIFALYGGFFAVLLASLGLSGVAHGIGYGEHREWRELPRSGPPPARFYLPSVHRYVSRDDAQRLWNHDPDLVGHKIPKMPIQYEYHDLMLHSLLTRADEVTNYSYLPLNRIVELLHHERAEFRARLASNGPDTVTSRVGRRACGHLDVWIEALEHLM